MMNGTSQDLSVCSMFDLFRSEVKTHTDAISEGIQALARDPSALKELDKLIHAAHSLKGGSRIVELDLAAELAGAMEKCFHLLQKGEVTFQSFHQDAVQQGVALLQQILQIPEEGLTAWAQAQQESSKAVIALISAVASPELSKPPASPREPPAPPPVAKADVPAPVPPPKASNGRAKASRPISMNFSGGSTDESMLELFRTEIETHTAALTEGLLALEENPSASEHLEALMRAAHSIKGGARVVELDPVVQLAHVMEDCFVAAQKKQLTLTSDHIDLLLQGVDLLGQIADAAGESLPEWLREHQNNVLTVATHIATILTGEPMASSESAVKSEPPVVAAPPPPVVAQKPAETLRPVRAESRRKPEPAADEIKAIESESEKRTSVPEAEERDRMVRVTAGKIERLMGLGGEVVVSARWLPQFAESILSLKKTYTDIFVLLERLQEGLADDEKQHHARGMVLQIREKMRESSLALADRITQLDMYTSTSANLSDRLYHEVIGVRMRPFADGVQRFPRMVRDLAKTLGKKVKLEILGKATDVDRDILEKLDAPLTHLLSNAIDHGLESPQQRVAAGKPETGTIRLEAVHRAGMLMISVSDDGRGIDLAKLRQKILERGLANAMIVENLTETELMEFLFLPGFSTAERITEVSGRGVGLDVVHDMVHEVGGVIRAVSSPGKGVSFHLELPLTLSVIRTFLVEIAGESYAFPLARIDRCLMIVEEDLEAVEDRQYFRFDNTNIALVDIRDILDIHSSIPHPAGLPVVVISDRSHSYGVLVDRFIGECDLVVRPVDPRLGKVPDISAVAVMLDGSPVLIFDVDDMLRSVDKIVNVRRLRKVQEGQEEEGREQAKKRILVVDDSITVREMERKILENQGYHVEVAVDGMDGWNALRTDPFDLVVTDIDMPRMNGIELVMNIKQHEDLRALPVIVISYKDTQEHRLQGLEAGANYYLTKSSFQDDSFINAVVDLIGEAR